MSSQQHKTQALSLVQLSKAEIKTYPWFAGVRPSLLRRSLLMWIAFIVLVAWAVSVAPALEQWFVLATYAVLVLFTFMIFWQSRIDEGWPSIVALPEGLGVVFDPFSREFIAIPREALQDVSPVLLKPAKRALRISLKAELLSEDDKSLLLTCVWPRDNALIAVTPFVSRKKIVAAITQWRNHHNI